MSRGTKFGLGGGLGAIVMVLISLFMGGDIGSVLPQLAGGMGGGQGTEEGSYQETPEEKELATFSKKIEASTEDVWSKIFMDNNLGEYQPPTLVLYTGSTSTACGQGSAAVGPFYCGGDQKLYIDLSFFGTMQQQLGAGASSPMPM